MSYTEAKEKYAAIGVDTEAAIAKLKTAPVSLHCWQGDDVRGFDTDPTKPLTGGIHTTGSYPGPMCIRDRAVARAAKKGVGGGTETGHVQTLNPAAA